MKERSSEILNLIFETACRTGRWAGTRGGLAALLAMCLATACVPVLAQQEPIALEQGALLALVAVDPTTVSADGQAAGTRAVLSDTARRTFIKNELLAWNTAIADPLQRDAKYADMMTSPFAFFRGTAHLFYKDVNGGVIAVPASWKTTPSVKTWIQGDLHTQNLGYFDNKNGTVKFDLNDFDDSFVAPYYWDLIRLAASVYLQRTQVGFNFSASEARTAVDGFLATYQDTLTAVNGNGTEKTAELTASKVDGFVFDRLNKLKSEKNTATLLARWTVLQSGARKFNFADPELKALTAAEANDLNLSWSAYLTDLGSFYTQKGAAYFTIKDRARRLSSGLGSQGLNKFYVLIQGASSATTDDVLLEIKEERLPSMFQVSSLSVATYNSWFANHGARTRTASKAMIAALEDHTGSFTFGGRPYLVRRISPYKFSFEAADFKSKSDMTNFLKYAARALAYAHARSDNDYNSTYVSYNFESGALASIAQWSQAKTTMRNLAESYADQVAQDYAFFLSLRASGEL